MDKMNVAFFKQSNGNEPTRDWLRGLPKDDSKKIGNDIRTVQYGWPIGMPLVKPVEGMKGIWEVRTKLDNTIARVFFTFFNEEIVLLHGFIKKDQKTPKKELEIVKQRLNKIIIKPCSRKKRLLHGIKLTPNNY